MMTTITVMSPPTTSKHGNWNVSVGVKKRNYRARSGAVVNTCIYITSLFLNFVCLL